MKNFLIKSTKVLLIIYVVVCALLFFYQEKLIFFPNKLDENFQFQFEQPFIEKTVLTKDHKKLNGILFKSDSSKGVIFYLHGNAGNLSGWGKCAKTYTDLNYDVFFIDYRGYGKSEGEIDGQELFFDDALTAYNELKKDYSENKIIVLGYSLGTGVATKVASVNHPKLLILQAPYYSIIDMMRHKYPIIPTFILKYPFETNKFLKECKMPVVIFHGDNDEVIYYESSLKLQELFKGTDRLITLKGQGHNGITENIEYKMELKKIVTSE